MEHKNFGQKRFKGSTIIGIKMKKEEIELVGAVHKAKTKSKRLFEDQVAVTVFKETARGMGKLKYNSHESYEEELEERLG